MSNDDKPFEAMFGMWRDGSDAFMKANMEMAENLKKSFSEAFDASQTGFDFSSGSPENNWHAFMKSWAPAWDASNLDFATGKDAIFSMLDPANWSKYAPDQLREILQNLANGPRFADLATPQIDAAASWREVLDYQSAMADFAKVMQEAWIRTYQRYSEQYSLDDLQNGNVKEALDSWLKIANEELLETQGSAAFLDAQKRLLRSGVEIQARQRDIAEAWSENYQMPTRSEIDDLTKIVHELRREVRKLKREVANLSKPAGKK